MEHMNDHSNKGRVEMGPNKGYALSGKIMLSAIVVLFVVVVFMVALHLYARWYLLRQRRRQLERRRQRRASRSSQVLVMADALTRQVVPVDRGLDVTVLNSLPLFLYSPSKKEHPKPPPSTECAVCLSEFEDKEIVRLLPKCNHSFHIECIDMWFHSHSTCPLCRSPVEKVVVKPAEKAISWDSGCSLPPPPLPPLSPQPPLVDRRKALELGVRIINVPPRIQPESEFCQTSPGNRFLALKRILSMGRKSPAAGCGSTTPRGAGTSRVAATELDLERGLGESSPGVVQAAT